MSSNLSINQNSPQKKLRIAWLVWGLAAAFYFFDYMARVTPSVMHRFLQLDFGMNEAQFGILTASFYVPYVLMQIPVGLMVDRVSIRWLLTLMSLLTAFGCCVFGLAESLGIASVGRMLIGFSAAFAMISALRLATSWFPPSMLGLLAGLTQALGMLGAATGQAPVSFLVDNIGWRHSMLVIAVLFIVLAVLLYQFIRDKPKSENYEYKPKTDEHVGLCSGVRVVLSSKQTWLNALYAGFLFGPTAVIGESLGAAYLQYGRGLHAHAAAFSIGLIFIGWSIGGPLSGWLSDRMGRRKPIMIASAICGFIFSSLIIFYPGLDQAMLYLLCFLLGFTNTGVAIAYALSTELHQRAVIGTAIAFTNMASILVGAALQPVVGKLVDHIAGAKAYNIEHILLSDFQFGLKILPACSLIALLLVLMLKETYCNPLKSEA
ncbi:MAG: MFS transporter [Legionella sp.]|jgi:MFS family permease|nr:MFS transporter [Legionella sp.]